MAELTLLGPSTRTTANLNKWLASKGCPQYAEYYILYGDRYGIRGDVAIFQSILETGWFWGNDLPHDVKKSQNNFAGLGATGNGVAGDFFATPALGIEAQIQDLALRAGVKISREKILSQYVQRPEIYEIVANRGSRYWLDLAGTWAMDPQYWVKIQSIMAQYDLWEKANGTATPPPSTGKSYRGELDPTTLNYRIIEEPGAKVYATVNTENGRNLHLLAACKTALELGAYRTILKAWDTVKPAPEPQPTPVTDSAKNYIEFYKANYQAVRNGVQRWFAGVYSPTATENGCVAHVVSALALTKLPKPAYDQLAAINVDAFVAWALSHGWTKNTSVTAIKPGDVCVSGADLQSLDHVYAFVSYKSPAIAMVLHNQQFGLCERYLYSGSCGEFKFSLRMPGGATNPTPPPTNGDKVKTIYLEPGHSKSVQGAQSQGEVNEYEMNELAAKIMIEMIQAAGHKTKTLNPDPDNLSTVGNGAKGCDAAFSIHHNAYDAKTDHYFRCYFAKTPKASSVALGNKIAIAVASELKLPEVNNENSGFTVPNIFNEVCSGPSMLLELYFIDAYKDRAVIVDRTTRAAKAVAQEIIKWANS